MRDSPLGSLLEFCAYAREHELPVGTDDAMAFSSAVSILDASKMEDVYWAGRATLCHSRNQIPIYNACFTQFFMGGKVDKGNPHITRSAQPREIDAVVDIPSGDQPEEGNEEEQANLGLLASNVLVNRTKSFDQSSEEEMEAFRRIISTLRSEPPMRRTRRHRTAPAGKRLDLRRMARETMRAHGEPGDMWWRKRRERPRKLVLILDISGSMSDYSRNLLLFAHSTKRATNNVEVFCFGTRLTRITHSLRRRSPDEALALAGKEVIDWAGGTRIGASLDDFVHRYARRGMARGALVIICSDGMDRGDPAVLDDALERLGRLSHKIIWMNPMKGESDEFVPTSLGMSVALPHVDLVWSGHNLESLEAFAETLPAVR